MPFTWESVYSFFSPPATRTSSPEGTPSLLSAAFSSKFNVPTTTKQTDLPMPPTTALGAAAAGPPMPSPAESSTSSLAASERDYFPPNSAYNSSRRRPSMSSTSTASTAASELQLPHQPQRSHTTPAPASQDERPPAPRRSATEVVAPEPMSRQFPKPTHEPSLDELLARKPGKFSLSHYVKNPREQKIPGELATEAEAAERARKFAEVKRKLVMDHEKIASLVEKR
ncbi:hypothetical protein C8A01DRAFT_32696 [Parachaetomium inaequale]|uniref:Uncharacterized protein n=1 Tax=Parachaetomium inaequale TaxID=2588326 RepID=A0AAN6SV35_9PEZI|nr:hypothetical protein C8A01DRAFT_32696 [Parachaetomium inaequale]